MSKSKSWPGRRTVPVDPKVPIADSWLFTNPGPWRVLPVTRHPRQCSWCGSVFNVTRSRFFRCPTCDMPEKPKEG